MSDVSQAVLWVREGVAAAQRKDYSVAAALFQSAAEAEPTFKRAWFCLGAARYHLGDMEGALDAWQRVAELDAGYANVETWIDVATQRAAETDG